MRRGSRGVRSPAFQAARATALPCGALALGLVMMLVLAAPAEGRPKPSPGEPPAQGSPASTSSTASGLQTPDSGLEVTGDAMPADASGDVIDVVGNVKVTRGKFVLAADRVRYEKKADTALATGEVRAAEGVFSLTCRRLKFYAGKQLAIAWDDPLLTRTAPLPDGLEELVEMRATQIKLSLEEQRVEGLDRVEVTRWIVRQGRRELDFRVSCDEAELDQVARSSLFRGGVRMDSPAMGALAERAWLEEPLDRLTLTGGAQAWGIGPGGEKTDRVRGAKIVHFLKGKRSIVFGSVEGRLRLGR